MLTRESILNCDDIKTENVKVPEWGGDVTVQEWTGLDKDKYDEWIFKHKQKDGTLSFENLRALVVYLSCVDKDGNRIFKESDVDALGRKSGAALDRIFSVAQRINALSDAEVDDLMGE